jgi:outer membrane immunogenic protein
MVGSIEDGEAQKRSVNTKGAERTMKKILGSFAITAALAGSAVAADLPVKARPMAPAPVVATNWTGCYVGAGGGYGMYNQDHRSVDPAFVPFATAEQTHGGRGWFGTVQVGCDYQFGQRWVVGAFGDWDFSSIKGNFAPTVSPAFVGEEKLKHSWAAGGRIGYLIFPGLLGYVSGGYTQATFAATDLSIFGVGFPTFTLAQQTYSGWFLGTGYEYALDFLPGLFWKTEYRYARYSAKDVPIYLFGTTTLAGGYEHATKDVHKVRTELVYRFNFGSAPLMAKY